MCVPTLVKYPFSYVPTSLHGLFIFLPVYNRGLKSAEGRAHVGRLGCFGSGARTYSVEVTVMNKYPLVWVVFKLLFGSPS